MRYRKQGFTFIELMAVMLLVLFLAAEAAPAYFDYLLRGQVAEGMLLTINIKRAIGDYYAYHGQFPTDNKRAGVSPPEQLMGNYVARVEVKQGNILVTFGNRSRHEIEGKVLTFQPEVNTLSPLGSIVWKCGKDKGTTVENKYLPGSCK